MGRRRSKSGKRRQQGGQAPARQAPVPEAPGVVSVDAVAQTAVGSSEATTPAPAGGVAQVGTMAVTEGTPTAGDRSALRPWRPRVQELLDHLLAWSRAKYGAALEDSLAQRFGSPEAAQAAAPEDVDLGIEDYVCARGSAGDERSILSVFVEQAPAPDGGPMDPEDREQARRWERERNRGVFLLQHASRDRLTLWDPLEGAPLTLHLLRKLGQTRSRGLQRGTVVTATYQPWMARLVAVGGVEFFDDERAISLFREETLESGSQWHEAPPAAPQRTRSK